MDLRIWLIQITLGHPIHLIISSRLTRVEHSTDIFIKNVSLHRIRVRMSPFYILTRMSHFTRSVWKELLEHQECLTSPDPCGKSYLNTKNVSLHQILVKWVTSTQILYHFTKYVLNDIITKNVSLYHILLECVTSAGWEIHTFLLVLLICHLGQLLQILHMYPCVCVFL